MTIEEWAKDFKSYVNALQMPRDDYKGIMSYIDDVLHEGVSTDTVADQDWVYEQIRNRVDKMY